MQTQPQPPADAPLQLPLRWQTSRPAEQVCISDDGQTALLNAKDLDVFVEASCAESDDAGPPPVAQRLRFRVRHLSGGGVRAALLLIQNESALVIWSDGDLISESKQLIEGQRWDEADRDYELQVSGQADAAAIRRGLSPPAPPVDSLAPADCHRLRSLACAC